MPLKPQVPNTGSACETALPSAMHLNSTASRRSRASRRREIGSRPVDSRDQLSMPHLQVRPLVRERLKQGLKCLCHGLLQIYEYRGGVLRIITPQCTAIRQAEGIGNKPRIQRGESMPQRPQEPVSRSHDVCDCATRIFRWGRTGAATKKVPKQPARANQGSRELASRLFSHAAVSRRPSHTGMSLRAATQGAGDLCRMPRVAGADLQVIRTCPVQPSAREISRLVSYIPLRCGLYA